MRCAERFANSTTSWNLNLSQMVETLSLPSAEETEKFIEQKATEGKAVADMTIKELREEIAALACHLLQIFFADSSRRYAALCGYLQR